MENCCEQLTEAVVRIKSGLMFIYWAVCLLVAVKAVDVLTKR